MGQLRINSTISPSAILLLEKIGKSTHLSRSELMERAIFQTYQDPLEHAKQRRRQLGIEMNELQDEIKRLEEIRREEAKK